MAFSLSQQSTARSSRKRKRVNYFDGDSDTDLNQPAQTRDARPVRRSCRVTYTEHETSSDDSDTGTSNDSSSIEYTPLLEARKRPSISVDQKISVVIPSRSRRLQKAAGVRPMFSDYKIRKPNQVARVASNLKANSTQTQSQKNTPPWADLEYQILVQILKIAAQSMSESASSLISCDRWLLSTSALCKSFHAASIATLLYNPPLSPSPRAHGLLHLLRQDPDTLSTNYRTKIRRLDVDVKQLLVKKSGIALPGLISMITNTPQLDHLRFYHPHDGIHAIWAQPGAAKGKTWAYPDEVFDKLDEAKIFLKSFEWNGRFPSTSQVLETMRRMHSRKCLRSAKTLRLVNLILPEKTTDEEKSCFAEGLIQALLELPELSAVEFRNCNIADNILIPKLPFLLERLSFIECNSVTSASLQEFLSSSGGPLKELNLASNQALDLGFMSSLATLTPHLEVLKIDLTYLDASSYHDTTPLFDELLPLGPPTWPSTLREIDLSNLRNLSLEELDSFLESLVGASKELLQLRKINIKAIAEGSWRERANARAKWERVFARVFKRTFSEQKASAKADIKPRQSRRAAPKRFRDESDSDTEVSDSTQATSSFTSDVSAHRQGMCEEVNLTIDNQRPSELQYKDEDFLDDEQSGDEEWRG